MDTVQDKYFTMQLKLMTDVLTISLRKLYEMGNVELLPSRQPYIRIHDENFRKDGGLIEIAPPRVDLYVEMEKRDSTETANIYPNEFLTYVSIGRSPVANARGLEDSDPHVDFFMGNRIYRLHLNPHPRRHPEKLNGKKNRYRVQISIQE